MTGVDTFYENLGILNIQLEACVCRTGMDPATCSSLCDGTFTLSCEPGYVEEYSQALGRPECVACPVGKYEYLGDCEFADSYSYVSSAGSSQYESCPANTRVLDVAIENGQVFLRPRRGAISLEECVVRSAHLYSNHMPRSTHSSVCSYLRTLIRSYSVRAQLLPALLHRHRDLVLAAVGREREQ